MIAAIARVKGKDGISGKVRFLQKSWGVLVTAEICGLPESDTVFFAFHIHEGNSCGGVDYADTRSHYNPCRVEHPCHAGDLPPLLRAGGSAYLQVMTDRFRVADVLGRTVVIHDKADDFTTQPSGNAGKKIACGIICPV